MTSGDVDCVKNMLLLLISALPNYFLHFRFFTSISERSVLLSLIPHEWPSTAAWSMLIQKQNISLFTDCTHETSSILS